MKLNRTRAVTAGIAALLALAGAFAADKDALPLDRLQSFMRLKLAYSQGLLEGITLERYELVTQNAIRLRDMSHTNAWSAVKSVDYTQHTKTFQKDVEALYLAAADKKLDAVTDAYMTVMRDCVDCHRHLRMAQRVRPRKGP